MNRFLQILLTALAGLLASPDASSGAIESVASEAWSANRSSQSSVEFRGDEPVAQNGLERDREQEEDDDDECSGGEHLPLAQRLVAVDQSRRLAPGSLGLIPRPAERPRAAPELSASLPRVRSRAGMAPVGRRARSP